MAGHLNVQGGFVCVCVCLYVLVHKTNLMRSGGNVPFGCWCACFSFPFTKANFGAPCFWILDVIGSEGDDVSGIVCIYIDRFGMKIYVYICIYTGTRDELLRKPCCGKFFLIIMLMIWMLLKIRCGILYTSVWVYPSPTHNLTDNL